MRVGIVSPDCLSILILFKELVFSLQRAGIDNITVICSSDEHLSEMKELNISHVSVKMERYMAPLYDIKYTYDLYKILKKEKFDVLLNFTPKPIIFGAIAGKLTGTNKIISAFRGLGRVYQNSEQFSEKVVKSTVTILYRVACKLSKLVWFTNKSDLEYFLRKRITEKEKTILTRNGINIGHFSQSLVQQNRLDQIKKDLGINQHDIAVIMVARMIWPKGIKEYADASRMLYNKYPNVRFILVGPLEKNSRYGISESYLKQCEIGSNLKWVGFRKDVRELYALSQIAVLPSYYKEGGYPRALLEPMALEKPVITTDTIDCKGPVENDRNGFLVSAESGEELAVAIESLITNKKKMASFGKRSREIIEQKFDEKVIFKRIVEEIISMK